MEKNKALKTADILRNTARYALLVLGILVSIFALVSGSEAYEGNINGIIQNSPNALPWLMLLVMVVIAWRWELVGGVLITLSGLAMLYFFTIRGQNFFLSTCILTSLIAILGSLFIASWYIRKHNS